MLLIELVEEMQMIGRNRSLDFRARGQAQIGIDAGDPELAVSEPHGEQLLVAKLLGDHDRALEGNLIAVPRRSQPNMLRTHADADQPPDARTQIGKTPPREAELPSLASQREMVAVRLHVDVDEIHRGRADEACDEPVGRLAVELERSAHL